MRIVIIGAGEVGFHVAKALSQDDHDITVIDIDPAKCKRASESLDVIVIEGNGASPRNLSEANVQEADYVLCVTRVDEVNLIASQQANELGAKKIIARLRNQQYTTRDSIIKPEKFGIAHVIHPEKEAVREIVKLVRHSYATQVMDFEGGRMQMIGIRIEESSPIVGKTVREICDEDREFRFGIVTVIRDGESHVPWSDFVFKHADTAYFIVKKQRLNSLMYMLGKEATETKSIVILGGSKIGRSIAEELENELNVRLIDGRRDKAEWLASNLKQTMVLHGDGTDVELLKAENIKDADSFISVTENEQTNLLSGMLAHHLGVKQTVIHLSTTEYMPIVQEIGLGAVISKNMSTVNSILKFISSSQTEKPVTTFDEIDVDVIEFSPEPDSKVTTLPLKDVKFPEDSIVGVINHHGQLSIARGSSQLTDEDTVLVFAKSNAIEKLRRLFEA
ncbi:MAG: Trk system potassium transporter TrkA [Candidatus Neomarinimicrobiota bacterium]|jgi:trk system potassium uptake protein TrkA|nr:Trk system potassium transporter TrkA [Candidatus Neomarinimicrobiota bacterium]MEC7872374.1 Trk system potassium transporter TrkA [Candidatus Neomarinimicrobiota bacterium]MEC9436732.1 Trk system potassium transporter TrkA [Candidatus Neomarinimicrobiota bacterium]MEC9474736.1 Trk system potassium transporter TrkA [Candidatus Neomarinimicrobiota bacterium]MED5434122.1 Trk system potassium transporter TrkA [Candidatus Neomarinimicrobiota bacterium]|tara:strand:+ start:267 stop:1613 length:1347 start_codon:yes stop_codon:yes gene_type:complete